MEANTSCLKQVHSVMDISYMGRGIERGGGSNPPLLIPSGPATDYLDYRRSGILLPNPVYLSDMVLLSFYIQVYDFVPYM